MVAREAPAPATGPPPRDADPGQAVPHRSTTRRSHPAPPNSTTPGASVTNPNLSAASAYILTLADWTDLETIIQAIRDRRTVLNASLSPGQAVRLSVLRRCYLKGLTGSVHAIDQARERAVVELDEASPQTLRRKGGKEYDTPQTGAIHPVWRTAGRLHPSLLNQPLLSRRALRRTRPHRPQDNNSEDNTMPETPRQTFQYGIWIFGVTAAEQLIAATGQLPIVLLDAPMWAHAYGLDRDDPSAVPLLGPGDGFDRAYATTTDKVWSKADFTKGDFVHYGRRWYEVLRVPPERRCPDRLQRLERAGRARQ